MDIFLKIVTAALISVFIQNSILERALGANVLLYAARKKDSLVGISVGITLITTISAIPVYFVDNALGGEEFYYLIAPPVYVGIISLIYTLSLIIIWRISPRAFRNIRKYVHLSVFNCSVIGGLFLCSAQGGDIFTYLGYGFGTGIGFLLAAYLIYIAYDRFTSELVPAAFRGMPIMLVYVGILALAFYAFVGYGIMS